VIISTFATPQTMAESLLSSEQIQEMVVRQAQAWETQDERAIADDFAEDAIFIAAGFKFAGKQQIRKAAQDYFKQFHQTSVKIKRIIIDDDCGAVEWDWRDQNRQTGKEGFAEDAIIFELANGKIIYWREYIEKKKER
jgi:uncharacterized protein (TIGR02246 family)